MAGIPRKDLLTIFRAGLDEVNGRRRVGRWLQEQRLPGPVWAIAIGKAAAAMAVGAQDVLGSGLQRGLLITKAGYPSVEDVGLRDFAGYESGHPLPDERSLAAGQRLLAFLRQAPPEAWLLFLLSGGASSLVEVLPKGLSLDDLRRANSWMLAHDFSIRTVNQIRKRLSCIKGGRLLEHLAGRHTMVLLISDVIGDEPAWIGSGLLTVATDTTDLPPGLPDWLHSWINIAPPPPRTADPRFERVATHVVATSGDARQAAGACARGLGYPVRIRRENLQGNAVEVGRSLAREVRAGASGVVIWGGETTMKLPENPGRGGRNQSLALAAAMEFAGQKGVWLLAAGTDGTDGPTDDAGALVDAGTIGRGTAKALDPLRCLQSADAGSFLEASGDLIRTGPTGTNVMDLVIGLKHRRLS